MKKLKNFDRERICSGYDEDCKYVKNVVYCYMGGLHFCLKCLTIHKFELADGYCPILHNKN